MMPPAVASTPAFLLPSTGPICGASQTIFPVSISNARRYFFPGSWSVSLFFAPLEVSFASHFSRARSEEHTSELQSHSDLVCRLLLEKKKHKLMIDNMS